MVTTELINEINAIQNHSELIHNGLDGVLLPNLQTLNLGRLDTYTDELYNDFMLFVKTNNEEYKCSIYEKIYNLSKRKRLIIARTYRKVFMNNYHHIRIKTPLMYCCNKQSDELFSRLIEMLDTNHNKLDEMSDIIDNIVHQERNIIITGLMSVIHRGQLK